MEEGVSSDVGKALNHNLQYYEFKQKGLVETMCECEYTGVSHSGSIIENKLLYAFAGLVRVAFKHNRNVSERITWDAISEFFN